MVVIFSREKKLLVQLFVWWKTNCLSMLSTSLLCKAVPLDSTFVENNIVSCDPKTASVQFLRVVFIRKYYTCMYVTDGRNKFFGTNTTYFRPWVFSTSHCKTEHSATQSAKTKSFWGVTFWLNKTSLLLYCVWSSKRWYPCIGVTEMVGKICPPTIVVVPPNSPLLC